MLPERTQHLLPLGLLVFHLTYFLLNFLKSVRVIHIYSLSCQLLSALCQIDKKASILSIYFIALNSILLF